MSSSSAIPAKLILDGEQRPIQLIPLDIANGQVIAIGSGSLPSTAFNADNDTLIYGSSNADCWIAVGVAPTASAAAGNMFLGKGVIVPIIVPAGHLIAVIQDGASVGNLSLIPTGEV